MTEVTEKKEAQTANDKVVSVNSLVMRHDIYELWKYPVLSAPTTSGIDSRYVGREPTNTHVEFKGRTETEAMNKAKKFWEKGQFGMGRIFVKLKK